MVLGDGELSLRWGRFRFMGPVGNRSNGLEGVGLNGGRVDFWKGRDLCGA